MTSFGKLIHSTLTTTTSNFVPMASNAKSTPDSAISSQQPTMSPNLKWMNTQMMSTKNYWHSSSESAQLQLGTHRQSSAGCLPNISTVKMGRRRSAASAACSSSRVMPFSRQSAPMCIITSACRNG